MRILKMKIPMSFTPEYLEKQLTDLYTTSGFVSENKLMKVLICNPELANENSNSVKFYIYSMGDLNYLDDSAIQYNLDVFKDYFKNTGLLSNISANNQLINKIGLRYCKENDFKDCIVLNNSKVVSETLNGNLFAIIENKIFTPPLKDGCSNNVMRSKIIELINNNIDGYTVLEESLSVFDIQKSDELFVINIDFGIKSVNSFRKKIFSSSITEIIKKRLNSLIV
jgi:branched-chain amino acid aminotransferase